MKKLFILLAAVVMTVSAMAQDIVNVVLQGDVSKYRYAYVIPTGGVTSSAGGGGTVFGGRYGVFGAAHQSPTKTVNPAEVITGQLMRLGYTILPNISPEFENQTMIVSYGFLSGPEREHYSYTSADIMIQFRDAKTQDLIASYETIGYGTTDSEGISEAISFALLLFQYTLDPGIDIEFESVHGIFMSMYFTNRTPFPVNNFVVRLRYYRNEELVHEQEVTINAKIGPNATVRKTIKRDKKARSWKLQVHAEVINYK